MQTNLGLKLVAVADINTLKLFTAQGIKIISSLHNFDLSSHSKHRYERREGFSQKKSHPGSVFEPHTAVKDIEHQESSRSASAHIEQVINSNHDIKEIVLIADPKTLGYIRQQLSQKIKQKLVKEVHKDLIHHTITDIENAAFH